VVLLGAKGAITRKVVLACFDPWWPDLNFAGACFAAGTNLWVERSFVSKDTSRERMSQADLYRSYAEACFLAAQATTDTAERAKWIGMAQHWLQWAQDEETKKPKPKEE